MTSSAPASDPVPGPAEPEEPASRGGRRPRSSRWRRAASLLAALTVVASLALNVFLYRLALDRYRAEQSLRMDPSGASIFAPRNAELPPPGVGRARVVLFGDSRVAMWSPEPVLDGCQVVNRGWPGETTGQALLRLDRDAIALRPRLVVIQSGINDLKGIGLFPEQAGEIEGRCVENLGEMVGRLGREGIGVALLAIYPVGPVGPARRPIWSDEIPRAIDRVNRRLASLAGPGVAVIDCGPVLADGGRMAGRFALDEFHINAPAYEALNRSLGPGLSRLLQHEAPGRVEANDALQ